LDKIDVDIYNGEVDFQSEDDRVTDALVFYLKAKGVREVVVTVGCILCMLVAAAGCFKVTQMIIAMFSKA
jgi:hypothetical protein